MTRINYIEIVEEIASGGAARIYKGVDTLTGYLVAVKVLWNELFKNEKLKLNFADEANHYLYLEHPNIVRLKDFIQKDDASYLVMEFIDGHNLEEHINKKTGAIPEARARLIMLKVLKGMEYAHQQGVLHLDIKPSNIMLTSDENVKIIDFGIASKVVDAGKDIIMGTPLYMSPEQTRGEALDEGSDIYSLGITYFQMLTGRPPLPGNITREELFDRIQKGNIPAARSFYPFISVAAENIIKKATSTARENRFASMAEFYTALNKM